MRQIFAVTTPLGYRVVLSRDRWRQIVRFKHPALAGREDEVRDCLQDPDLIRESDKDPEVHVYYRLSKKGFLCTVVAPTESDDRFVIPAYFTKKPKKGKELWKK